MAHHPEEEIRVAFVIWEVLSQLEVLLWDRDFEECNTIMFESEKKKGMALDFPFHPKKDF